MPGVAQRVGRGIALLYHDRDARRWVSGQQHAPAALYHPGERLGTNCTGGWVGPRAGLDGRKISSPPGFDPGRDCRVINWKWRVRKYSLPDEAHVKGNCLGEEKTDEKFMAIFSQRNRRLAGIRNKSIRERMTNGVTDSPSPREYYSK